jgi:predicted transcriptional regulator
VHRLLDENESLSPVALADIQASLEEVRQGEFVTHEALKRDLGIE